MNQSSQRYLVGPRLVHQRSDLKCQSSCRCGTHYVEVGWPQVESEPGEWQTGDEARARRVIATLAPLMCEEAPHKNCLGEIPDDRASSRYCSEKCASRARKRRERWTLRQMHAEDLHIIINVVDEEIVEELEAINRRRDVEPAVLFGVQTTRAVVDAFRRAA